MMTEIESSTTVMQHPNASDQQRDDVPNQDLNLNEESTAVEKPPSPVAVASSASSTRSENSSNNTTPAATTPAATPTTGAYHPQFMFCGACTTCAVTTGNDDDNDNDEASDTPLPTSTMPNVPLMQLPNYAKYKNKYKRQMNGAATHRTKRTMVYVAAATGSFDDSDDDGEDDNLNGDANGDIEIASPTSEQISEGDANAASTLNASGAGGNTMNNDQNENHESASIFISNLTSPSQIMLIHSSLDPSEGDGYEENEITSACVGGKGVFSVRTYLNDDTLKNDKQRAKTVDVVFDPILISLDTMVKSLRDLGLDAKGTTTQKSRTNNNRSAGGDIERQNQATKNKKKKPCRSSLHVEGICCASEVPQVTNILRRSSAGVQKVRINITSRMVYVDHDPNVITVSDMADHLNREGFGATIKKDGGAQVLRKRGGQVQVDLDMPVESSQTGGQMTQENHCTLHQEQLVMTSSSTPNFVESTLMAPSLSAMEDAECIEDVLDGADLFTKNKIRYVEPNIASRTIKVEHNPKLVSAQSVADALMDHGGYSNVTVLVDGDREHLVLPKTMDSMRLDSDLGRQRRWWNRLPKGLGLNIIFSGIFWIVSLFGHFVEEWYVQYKPRYIYFMNI